MWRLLVCEAVQHIAKESLEASLVGPHCEYRMLIQLINVLFAGVEAQHNNLLHLVFKDFYDSWEYSRVDKMNIVLLFSTFEDSRDLLDKLFHSLLSELPASVEDSHSALLTEIR